MSDWKVDELAAALPVDDTSAAPAAPVNDGPNPQEHGWVKKESYDYARYNMSNKELADANAANQASLGNQGSSFQVRSDDWAGNAAVYEWKDEYGDVGPRFPDIETQLFGSEMHVRSGVNFNE